MVIERPSAFSPFTLALSSLRGKGTGNARTEKSGAAFHRLPISRHYDYGDFGSACDPDGRPEFARVMFLR
jgi:hypothetical protein